MSAAAKKPRLSSAQQYALRQVNQASRQTEGTYYIAASGPTLEALARHGMIIRIGWDGGHRPRYAPTIAGYAFLGVEPPDADQTAAIEAAEALRKKEAEDRKAAERARPLPVRLRAAAGGWSGPTRALLIEAADALAAAAAGEREACARLLEPYAESYESMAKGGDGRVGCGSVAVDLRQNMIAAIRARSEGKEGV